MPRPNRPRHIGGEASLAERIKFEREQAGMSPAGLASRMEKAGCPINVSAIYKIEGGDPPRRITVDELVAFARVFDVPVDDLLVPANVVREKKLLDGIDKLTDRFFALRAARKEYDDEVGRLRELAAQLDYRLILPAESADAVTDDIAWIVDIQ